MWILLRVSGASALTRSCRTISPAQEDEHRTRTVSVCEVASLWLALMLCANCAPEQPNLSAIVQQFDRLEKQNRRSPRRDPGAATAVGRRTRARRWLPPSPPAEERLQVCQERRTGSSPEPESGLAALAFSPSLSLLLSNAYVNTVQRPSPYRRFVECSAAHAGRTARRDGARVTARDAGNGTRPKVNGPLYMDFFAKHGIDLRVQEWAIGCNLTGHAAAVSQQYGGTRTLMGIDPDYWLVRTSPSLLPSGAKLLSARRVSPHQRWKSWLWRQPDWNRNFCKTINGHPGPGRPSSDSGKLGAIVPEAFTSTLESSRPVSRPELRFDASFRMTVISRLRPGFQYDARGRDERSFATL